MLASFFARGHRVAYWRALKHAIEISNINRALHDIKMQLRPYLFEWILSANCVSLDRAKRYRMKTVNGECRVISIPINPLVIARRPRITSHARSLQRETRNSVREISLVIPCIIVPTDARWKPVRIAPLRSPINARANAHFLAVILIKGSMNWSPVSLQLHAHQFHLAALQCPDKEATWCCHSFPKRSKH